MNRKVIKAGFLAAALIASSAFGQIGRRWPSEKKIVPDPVTGVPLMFLTSPPDGAAHKIYQTHQQWTSDGKWLLFGGFPGAGGNAVVANEETGDIVQVTENGYNGMLCTAHKSMKLYIMQSGGGGRGGRGRGAPAATAPTAGTEAGAAGAAGGSQPARGRGRGQGAPNQIVEIDLARVLADSAAGKLQPASAYERICGTCPVGADGNMGIDANDDYVYFRMTGPDTAQLSEGQTLQAAYGQRNMGAGPSGLRSMNLKTGEVKTICNVGFQIGHVQTAPENPGEIIFCWETGGKAPTRAWFVRSDGSELRPLYPEADFEWITHEAAFRKDEVALAIIAHKRVGAKDEWGIAGTPEHPSGIAIINTRTREMRIVGQVPLGNPGRSDWHVAASQDGRWAAFDDFQYRLWLVDRTNGETVLLADLGHRTGGQNRVAASDHIHPTFSLDSTRIEVQCAMLSPDDSGRMDVCVVPIPKAYLNRTYNQKLPE